VTGALEAATGLVLLMAPSVLVELLLGAAPGTPAGVTVSRVAGVALLALGVACWLAREDPAGRAAKGLVAAVLLYNVAVVAIMVLAWISLELFGIAFWPVDSGAHGAGRLVHRVPVDANPRRETVLDEIQLPARCPRTWRKQA
jgi:hypothetical protein